MLIVCKRVSQCTLHIAYIIDYKKLLTVSVIKLDFVLSLLLLLFVCLFVLLMHFLGFFLLFFFGLIFQMVYFYHKR